MRAASFATISPNAPVTSLPVTLEQRAARVSPLLMVALALPATAAAMTPVWLIAQHPERAQLFSRLATSIPVALAFIVWVLLFALPIGLRALRIGQRRSISIWNGRVRVTERSPLRESTWSEPLSSYQGLAHHVRSSLSGTRHELILIHPDRAHSVLLRAALTIHQKEIDGLVHLLGCREIAPQLFYPSLQRQVEPVVRRGLAAVG